MYRQQRKQQQAGMQQPASKLNRQPNKMIISAILHPANRLSMTEKATLLVLADHYIFETKRSYISARTVEIEATMSAEAIWVALQSLEAKGWITKELGEVNGFSTYRVHPPALFCDDPDYQ